MWLTGKRTLFTLYSVLGVQLHCTLFVSWLFCTLWWLHTMCFYHVCACTVDYVHRLCSVHVLYCLSWLQTVYCALPVFIVNVHEHCLHWLCCTLWNAHCEMHTVCSTPPPLPPLPPLSPSVAAQRHMANLHSQQYSLLVHCITTCLLCVSSV